MLHLHFHGRRRTRATSSAIDPSHSRQREATPEVWMLLEDRDGERFRSGGGGLSLPLVAC
jgi:hypothetical protein